MKKRFNTLFDKLLYAYLARHPRYSIVVMKWQYASLRIRKLRKAVLYLLYILMMSSFLTVTGLYFYFAKDLPTLDEITKYRPNTVTRVYSHDGTLIGEYAIEKRYVLPLSEIPEKVIQAFVAAEDASFFTHPGLDFFSILRAFIKNVREGDVVQGGSTITQQVAKSLLSPEKTLERKAKEAILAYRIEKNLTKDEIIHLYLNQIYLGHGAYGVQAAAQNYFHKDISELNLSEISTLAGLPQAPSKYSPASSPGKARERQLYVLFRMVEEKYINIVEATDAMNTSLTIYPTEDINRTVAPYFTEHIRRYLEETYGADTLYRQGLAVFTTVDMEMQGAAQKALRKGLHELDKRQGYRGPLMHLEAVEIADYIDILEAKLTMVPLAEEEIHEGVITEIDSKKGYAGVRLGKEITGRIYLRDMQWARKPDPDVAHYNAIVTDPAQIFSIGDVVQVKATGAISDSDKIKLSLYQQPQVQGALLSINPENGYVKAMVGGFDFEKSKFNRAVQAKRQPGSAFKPIIYSAAIDKGYTPSSIIVDAPLSFRGNSKGTVWKPQNYDHRYHGPTTLRNALITSRNIVTIKIARDIGLNYIIDYARIMGIESHLAKDLSLSLGSSSLSLLELTSAYSVFPAGGTKHQPVFITKIIDRDGNLLELHSPLEAINELQKEEKAPSLATKQNFSGTTPEDPPDGFSISPQTAYIMTSLLQGVVQDGTGWRAKSLNRPMAGKTGTTNDNVDAWFIGFTPDLVTGTWIGFDEQQSLGRYETGSNAAAPVFVDYMSDVLKDKPVKDFILPDGIDCTSIDSKTGLRAYYGQKENSVTQCYKKGTAPTQRAQRPSLEVKDVEVVIKEEVIIEEPNAPEEPVGDAALNKMDAF